MLKHVLVTYVSRYGSTQEVADTIADHLRTSGLTVDVQSAHEVQTLDIYDVIVLGAPLYLGRWHQDAHQFLLQHQTAIAQRTIAIFALGPLNTHKTEIQGSRQQLDHELKMYPWLKPVDVKVFVGKFDPTKLNLFHSLLAALPESPLYDLPLTDNRSWEHIGMWASELIIKLQSLTHAPLSVGSNVDSDRRQ